MLGRKLPRLVNMTISSRKSRETPAPRTHQESPEGGRPRSRRGSVNGGSNSGVVAACLPTRRERYNALIEKSRQSEQVAVMFQDRADDHRRSGRNVAAADLERIADRHRLTADEFKTAACAKWIRAIDRGAW